MIFEASKTQVPDKIFKLSLIHASMIYQFPEFSEFAEFLFQLGETPLCSLTKSKLVHNFKRKLCAGIRHVMQKHTSD